MFKKGVWKAPCDLHQRPAARTSAWLAWAAAGFDAASERPLRVGSPNPCAA